MKTSGYKSREASERYNLEAGDDAIEARARRATPDGETEIHAGRGPLELSHFNQENKMKINQKLIIAPVILLVFFSGVAAAPQQEVEHAPTVSQCDADQALWASKLKTGPNGVDEITFRTLLAWHKEMDKCEAVDQPNSDKYHITGHDALAAMFLRQYHFMERHSLTDKFYAEDDGGKR